MKIDLAVAFEQHDDEFLKFDRVEPKLHSRPDLCAWLLLDKLLPSTRDMVCAAEHDEIWLDIDCEKLAGIISNDDVRTLVRCGVRYDAEIDSLCMYV